MPIDVARAAPVAVEELLLARPRGASAAVQRWPGPDRPPVLLLHGAATSSTMWPPGFVAQLARSRPVLLLDLRDAGRSSRSSGERPDHTATDLVEDAAAALGGAAAHVIGLSMGGGLAQRLALAHPDAVRSVTLMSTAAVIDQPGLPPMDESLFAEPAVPEGLVGEAAVVARLVEGERAFLGDAFDEAEQTAAAVRMLRRAADVESAERHLLVEEPEAPADLRGIRCPALVVHGDADRLFPLAHAEALAAALPDARLLVLERAGHGFPPPRWWPPLLDALEGFLAAADA